MLKAKSVDIELALSEKDVGYCAQLIELELEQYNYFINNIL